MYKLFGKRLLDIVCSTLLILLLSPIYLILFVLVRIKLGAPIIFCQKRPGKHEKVFNMYKFRTMTNEKDEHGELLPDVLRLVGFGKLLRKTSLDELPELINILKGDMSFVGPRPLLVKYLPRYNERQRHRHDVKPGLTGLAQVKGRNSLSWEEKFEYDIEYVNNISFIQDIKILLATVGVVFKRKGINQEGEATMEEFMGSKKGA